MTPTHTAAERRVLRRITPPAVPKVVETVLARARKALHAEVSLGGSTAKGTFLADDHDVDIFVRYPKGTRDISELTARALGKAFPRVERVHGSRDYFQVRRAPYTFEFVPVLDIRSWRDAENVTDMSPLHVAYVRAHLGKRPWLADEVRLAKQFCKAQRAYGAESYIGGFSGHVLELLTIHYGGFRKLLAAASRWRTPTVIDPGRHHADAFRALNESKTQCPLILVDPVQPERNAAAALSRERFERFRDAARAYRSAKDQARFFRIGRLTRAEMRRAHPGADILTVTLTPLQGKRDIQGAKCQAVFLHLQLHLREHGFTLLGADWEFAGKATLFFALGKGKPSAEIVKQGPPLTAADDVARFKAKHARTFTSGGRILARERRPFTDARKLLAALCKDEYVRRRVRRAAGGKG